MSDDSFIFDLLAENPDTDFSEFLPKESKNTFAIVPEEEKTADEEYNRIIDEFGLSSVLNESAMYRVFRMKTNGKWSQVTDVTTGLKIFGTWEEFISAVSSVTGRGRQTIFNRVKTYAQLQILGYDDEEMINMMTKAPFIYQRALSYLMDFDVRSNEIKQIHYADIDFEENPDLVISDVKEIIDSLSSFEKGKEALEYIETDILMNPIVNIDVNDRDITVYWTTFNKDDNGIVIPDVNHVVFETDHTPPDWVLDKLAVMLK